MSKAFQCDKCKELILQARERDTYYPKRIRVDVQYSHAMTAKPLDICLQCRIELLKLIIQGIEVKQKYTWEDLKDPQKLGELL